ncbi:MAG: DNA-directed RNA polymerase subunit omega [Deltaproteobacteria bacterium]|nr:DNA-directed RNA polymerase subunit omega [Deltaproteobacteria bacterium]
MARITIEDCLRQIPNRFTLVNAVVARVRQLREGSRYLVDSPNNEQIVIALREVAAGKVFLEEQEIENIEPDDQEEQENSNHALSREDV